MDRVRVDGGGGLKKQLNHSRYLDYGARDTGNYSYYRAKETPTAKQVKFYKKLYALCKTHDIDPKVGKYTVTRMDYSIAINTLIERLTEKGIDVKTNNKNATHVITHGTDHAGRYYTSERIVVEDGAKND